jgi:hypothetical protein
MAAPSRQNSVAVAAPIPAPAPVISATLPTSRDSLIFINSNSGGANGALSFFSVKLGQERRSFNGHYDVDE